MAEVIITAVDESDKGDIVGFNLLNVLLCRKCEVPHSNYLGSTCVVSPLTNNRAVFMPGLGSSPEDPSACGIGKAYRDRTRRP